MPPLVPIDAPAHPVIIPIDEVSGPAELTIFHKLVAAVLTYVTM